MQAQKEHQTQIISNQLCAHVKKLDPTKMVDQGTLSKNDLSLYNGYFKDLDEDKNGKVSL